MHIPITPGASVWSPSASMSFFGLSFEIGAEVGSVGILGKISEDSISIGFALGFGGDLTISW